MKDSELESIKKKRKELKFVGKVLVDSDISHNRLYGLQNIPNIPRCGQGIVVIDCETRKRYNTHIDFHNEGLISAGLVGLWDENGRRDKLSPGDKIGIAIDPKNNRILYVCFRYQKYTKNKKDKKEGIKMLDNDKEKDRIITDFNNGDISRNKKDYTDRKPKLLCFNGVVYKISGWIDIPKTIVNIMHNVHGTDFDRNIIQIRGSITKLFSKNSTDISDPELITGTDIYMVKQMAINTMVELSLAVVEQFMHKAGELRILLADVNKPNNIDIKSLEPFTWEKEEDLNPSGYDRSAILSISSIKHTLPAQGFKIIKLFIVDYRDGEFLELEKRDQQYEARGVDPIKEKSLTDLKRKYEIDGNLLRKNKKCRVRFGLLYKNNNHLIIVNFQVIDSNMGLDAKKKAEEDAKKKAEEDAKKKAEEERILSITENELVEHIYRHISERGYTFSKDQIINYYLSLKTKPFVINTGISGTGKTRLPKIFAELVCQDFDNQFLLLPVRPDWNDDKHLIGYYNPLTKLYQSTAFLNFIMRASDDLNNPYFVCIDEMNIARVEYYFSAFLSAMESSGEIHLHDSGIFKKEDGGKFVKTEDGKNIPLKIKIPPNIFFIGTINMDETTYKPSQKVLDRASTIGFNDVDLLIRDINNIENDLSRSDIIIVFRRHFLNDEIRNKDRTKAYKNDKHYQDWEDQNWNKIVGFLDNINKSSLEKYDLHFGYRIRDIILRYMYYAYKLGNNDFTEGTALDYQIVQKIIPRIEGSDFIPIFESLEKIITPKKYPKSSAKLMRMYEKCEIFGATK